MRYVFLALVPIWLIFMSACSHHNSLQSFNKQYYAGNDKKAYEYAKGEAGSNGDVLWNLQAGISGFNSSQKDTATLLEKGEE